MNVNIAYTDICLPGYFGGDHRPWVAIYPTEKGYTSSELREAIKSEFSQGAIGGSCELMYDFIPDEKDQKRADIFFQKALPACLNRDIKYRGKRHKYSEYDIKISDVDECEDLPLLHIVFDIEEDTD
jgi:hypothetical protein